MSRLPTVAGLLNGIAQAPPALADRVLSGLCLDSRAVRPGDAFVALAGQRSHGLSHLAQAQQQGAACILFEPPAPDALELPANALAIPQLRQRLGAMADAFHAAPSASMQVIGVTGTNGKTSTVQLLSQALDACGLGPCGTIGTLGVGLGEELRAGDRTTPDVITVHATLAELRDRGARAVAMEASSHALDQGRVDAVRFAVAVFTNLSHDHLDYHGDMAQYAAAKQRLLQWPALAATVVNIDDPVGAEMAAGLDPARCWTLSSRGGSARLRAQAVLLDSQGLAFELCEANQRASVRSPLLGRFNVDNLLAVCACLRALGLSLETAAAACGQLRPVPGRMNRIAAGRPAPLVVVDYAHTPDALEQALHSLRAHTPGRLTCVFGCGGDRDRGKRPLMAAIAERLADRVIVTDDNPRDENGEQIVQEICAGFTAPAAIRVLRDRASAIDTAIREAAVGDIVLIAGKGHEPFQQVGAVKHPFLDADVARRVLELIQ